MHVKKIVFFFSGEVDTEDEARAPRGRGGRARVGVALLRRRDGRRGPRLLVGAQHAPRRLRGARRGLAGRQEVY